MRIIDLKVLDKLDYTIYSSKDRVKHVNNILRADLATAHFTDPSTQKQLEGLANYILFGKEGEKNAVQKKEIQIEVKNPSYRRKSAESLDALLETPGYTEDNFVEKPIYTNPKPRISRITDGDIPGMRDLWEVIDKLAIQVAALKTAGGLKYYKLNHLLISLRQQQYLLKESYKPAFRAENRRTEPVRFLNLTTDTGYTENGTFHLISKNAVDLTNPKHMAAVIDNYGALKKYTWDTPISDSKFLLYEFEDVVDAAPLSPEKKFILLAKIEKMTNEDIATTIRANYGKTYSANYISTIFTKNICNDLSNFLNLRQDEARWRHVPSKWKRCSCCGKRKLNDKRNFVSNAAKADKLSTRCKECDRRKV